MNPSEYRKKMQAQVKAAAKTLQKGAADFRRSSATPAARIKALRDIGQLYDAKDLALARKIAADRKEPAVLRAAALGQLGPALSDSPGTIKLVIAFLGSATETLAVRAAALDLLKAADFHVAGFRSHRPQYIAALRSAAEAPDRMLRQRALGVLAREKDAPTLKRLEQGLRDAAKALVPPEKALQLLRYDIKRDMHELLLDIVQKPPGAEAQEQALRTLATDVSSKDVLEAVLRDKTQPRPARLIAMAGLQSLDSEGLQQIAGAIVADESEEEEVRQACLVAATAFGDEKAPHDALRKGAEQLAATARSPGARRAAARYLAKPPKPDE